MISRSTIAILIGLSIVMPGAASDVGVMPPPVSSFTTCKMQRDPFERIDSKYLAEKSSVVLALERPAGENIRDLLRMSGVSEGRVSIALINGKAFAEKESFVLRTKDKEIRVTVRRVHSAGVELDCDGTITELPIFRKKPSLMQDHATTLRLSPEGQNVR